MKICFLFFSTAALLLGCKAVPNIAVRSQRIVCEPPKCGEPGCGIRILPNEPCPKCLCEDDIKVINPRCGPPKCSPGCTVQKVFDGLCPGCDCPEDKDEIKDEPKIECSPPKCENGCTVETVFEGLCPGCKCEDDVQRCPPEPVCQPECQLVPEDGGTGCRVCKCRPKCTRPRCRDICRITRGGPLECPVCDCSDWGKRYHTLFAYKKFRQ